MRYYKASLARLFMNEPGRFKLHTQFASLSFLFLLSLVVLPFVDAKTTSVNEHGLQEASRYAKKKDYKSAYKRFKLMAVKGCPYSQCILGIMHQKGLGVEKNAQQAAYWFEQSAKQGYADAEHRLGKLHLDGNGIARDVESGAKWLEKAAQHGVVEAQYELGKLDVTERSAQAFDEGRAWLQQAASQGFHKAAELAATLPELPQRAEPAGSRTYERGLQGIQKSWSGYADLARSLDSVNSAASK